MWTSGYLNCLKFNSQKFPRIPPFLYYRQFVQLRIPKNSKCSQNWSLPFPKIPKLPSFLIRAYLHCWEFMRIPGNSQEFPGIPRKLGIQLARVICIIGFLRIPRNSQKTGNSVRKGITYVSLLLNAAIRGIFLAVIYICKPGTIHGRKNNFILPFLLEGCLVYQICQVQYLQSHNN